ncbi:MAG: CarD family transcriptional regulator [Terriglobia bacterium]
MDFQVGDKVVYPNQGVGTVEQISSRNLTGTAETFYLLKLESNGLRVMVPVTNVPVIGLRKVAKVREVSSVLDYLTAGQRGQKADWKGRFKLNSDKMRSGLLHQVAEVFKTLVMLSQDKPLSFREKKMLDRSWQLLVDEISVARGVSRDTIECELARTLSERNLKVAPPA